MKLLCVSLGCDKNLVDSEKMMGLLREDGWTFTDEEEDADAALEAQLEALRRKNVEQWEQERQALLGLLDRRREVLRETEQREYSLAREKEEENKRLLALGGELAQKERALVKREDLEGSFAVFLEENASRRYAQLKEDCQAGREKAGGRSWRKVHRLCNTGRRTQW